MSKLKRWYNSKVDRVWRICEHPWCTILQLHSGKCYKHAEPFTIKWKEDKEIL
jgi:hypothetical protein